MAMIQILNETLRLPIKGKWFDKCISGEKKEEYRDIKPYYLRRFKNHDNTFKPFKYVELINGYGHRSPRAVFECKGIREGLGDIRMGAPFVYCYIIELGKMIKHIKPWENWNSRDGKDNI
jgi:hypothetical protein